MFMHVQALCVVTAWRLLNIYLQRVSC